MAVPNPPNDALAVEHHLAQGGRLSAAVIHELNNQLAAISGYTELLVDKPEAAPFERQLRRVLGAADRARELVACFRETTTLFAATEPLKLGYALETVVRARAFRFEKRSLELTVNIAPDLPTLRLNPGHVQLALGALLDNAYEEMAPRAMGRCTVSAVPLGTTGARVEIVNDSAAAPAEPAPWRTTKDPTKHAGVGFTVARWIAESAGGTCTIDEATPGCTRVRWSVGERDAPPAP